MSRIVVRPNGTIEFIYSDDLRGLLGEGFSVIERVSSVEPGGGGWTADLAQVSGPVLGPFETRAEALAEEVKWLERHVL